MLFVSDIHLSNNEIMGIDTNKIFNAVVDKLQDYDDKSIIFLGDNVQYGSKAEYDLFFEYITNIKDRNIYILSGNHDKNDILEQYCRENNVFFCLNNHFFIENEPYYFLDTVVPNKDYGMVSEFSLNKLTNYLDKTDEKIILCAHHHLHPTSTFMDEYITKNNEMVIKILEKYTDKLKYVISGHTHEYNQYLKNDINYIHAPSASLGFKKENNRIFSTKKSQLLRYINKMELIDASDVFEGLVEN